MVELTAKQVRVAAQGIPKMISPLAIRGLANCHFMCDPPLRHISTTHPCPTPLPQSPGQRGSAVRSIVVPAQHIPAIIGPGGSVIRELESRSGARLKVWHARGIPGCTTLALSQVGVDPLLYSRVCRRVSADGLFF